MRMMRAIGTATFMAALLAGCSSDQEGASPTGTAAPSAPAPRPVDSGDGTLPASESTGEQPVEQGCTDRPKATTDVPEKMPAFTWAEAEGLHFPTAPEGAGPRVWPAGGVPSCFAHTPLGAVIAGMAYEDHLSNASTVEQVVSPGPRLDAYRRELGGEDRNANPGGEAITVAGFRLLETSKNVTRVEYLLTNDAGDRKVVSTQQLRWVDDDWKIDGQVTNAELGQGREVSDTAGFTMFSGG